MAPEETVVTVTVKQNGGVTLQLDQDRALKLLGTLNWVCVHLDSKDCLRLEMGEIANRMFAEMFGIHGSTLPSSALCAGAALSIAADV